MTALIARRKAAGMSDWTEFLLALAIFLGAHIIPARPRLRAALIARLGRRGYLLGFSLLSLGLLYWLIIAAGGRLLCRCGMRKSGNAGWSIWRCRLRLPLRFWRRAWAD